MYKENARVGAKEFKFNLSAFELAKTISNSLHAQLSSRILSDDFSVKIFDDYDESRAVLRW